MAKRSFVDALVDSVNNTGTETRRGSVRRDGGYVGAEAGIGYQNKYGTSYVDLISQIYEMFNGGSSLEDVIRQMSVANGNDLNDSQIDDLNKQLLDQALNLASTNENRAYNEQLRDEQRLYDNPQNRLARLMGAGISRDAAIQMLSGGSGSGGAGVPYSDPAAAAASAIPASQSTLNGAQTYAAYAGVAMQGVFGAIQAIGGLCSLGLSIPQAVQSVKGAQIANQLSDKQLKGLQATDAVLGSINNAVATGVLSTQDVDGFSNATDALNYINDHRDTNAFKGVFDSGAFDQVYGTKLGRDMFAQAWKSVRSSKDDGTILDDFIKTNRAKREYAEFDAKKAYFGVQYAIGELAEQDVRIQNLWNDVWSGNIAIQIAGEDLKIKQFESHQAGVRDDIFKAVYETKSPLDPDGIDVRGLSGNGARYAAYSQFSNLAMQFDRAMALNGSGAQRDSWVKFFMNNSQAAQLCAGIKVTMSEIQSGLIDPEKSPNVSYMVSMYELLKLTGALDVIEVGADVASRFL